MSKVTAPLLSLGASGTIGKSVVFGSWRGVPYARQHVVPANPNTAGQQSTRNTFTGMDLQFKLSLDLAQAPWKLGSKGKPLTDRNLYLSKNVKALRGQADMSAFVASPGVNGGLPGLNFVAAGGGASGEIDIDLDVGQNPIDWSADFVIFTAFQDRDPAVLPTVFVVEASVAGPGDVYVPPVTVSHTFAGLTGGANYLCSAWIQWTRSDGITAYGVASSGIATATA